MLQRHPYLSNDAASRCYSPQLARCSRSLQVVQPACITHVQSSGSSRPQTRMVSKKLGQESANEISRSHDQKTTETTYIRKEHTTQHQQKDKARPIEHTHRKANKEQSNNNDNKQITVNIDNEDNNPDAKVLNPKYSQVARYVVLL